MEILFATRRQRLDFGEVGHMGVNIRLWDPFPLPQQIAGGAVVYTAFFGPFYPVSFFFSYDNVGVGLKGIVEI